MLVDEGSSTDSCLVIANEEAICEEHRVWVNAASQQRRAQEEGVYQNYYFSTLASTLVSC
jgi:hypothetical protein